MLGGGIGGGEGVDGGGCSVSKPTRGEKAWLRTLSFSAMTLSFEPLRSAWAISVPFSSIASSA